MNSINSLITQKELAKNIAAGKKIRNPGDPVDIEPTDECISGFGRKVTDPDCQKCDTDQITVNGVCESCSDGMTANELQTSCKKGSPPPSQCNGVKTVFSKDPTVYIRGSYCNAAKEEIDCPEGSYCPGGAKQARACKGLIECGYEADKGSLNIQSSQYIIERLL